MCQPEIVIVVTKRSQRWDRLLSGLAASMTAMTSHENQQLLLAFKSPPMERKTRRAFRI